jgi:hypothetical protein
MIRNESVVTADVTWSTISDASAATPTAAAASTSSSAENGATDNMFSSTSKILQAISQQIQSSNSQSANTPANNIQCLVTWEISGGGLMGNLLTESSNVQLSLWPDTNYHVRVTCRNKVSYHITIYQYFSLLLFIQIIMSGERRAQHRQPGIPFGRNGDVK